MPHTINLVSQFEDIIRRGGNELENNISNAVRSGWVQQSGSKKKRRGWHQRNHHSEDDESPPPIPQRVPITSYGVGYHDRYGETRLLRNNSKIPNLNESNKGKTIFVINNGDAVRQFQLHGE